MGEDEDNEASYIGYSGMHISGRSLFGISLQYQGEEKGDPESLEYYDPILEIKGWDALKYELEGIRDDHSLVIWNIKKFRRFNLLFGQRAGTHLLKEIVLWLKKYVSPTDIYRMPQARLGIIVADEKLPEHLQMKEYFLEQVLPHFTEYPLYVDSIEVPLSLYGDTERMLQHLDYLIEKNHTEFADRHILFTLDEKNDAGRKEQLTHIVMDKLTNEDFQAYFQPIIRAGTGKCEKCEVLARLYDEEYGWISPAEFVPILEDSGLIHELDQIILNKACRMILYRKEQGLHPLQFHINISAMEFLREDLMKNYLKIIRDYGADPALIRFEITETALMQSMDYSIRVMQELEKDGVYFSMDDFGTGYSNFIEIAKLPVSEIKLDKSFLDATEKSEKARQMYDSLLEMFRKMELSVVAEGVETEKQYHYLKERHADYLQGYYISRPLSEVVFKEQCR